MKTRTHSHLLLLITATVFIGRLSPAQPVIPVSRSNLTGLMGNGGSFASVLSADGRFVAFVSCASDLVTNDNQAPFLDVFVRDLAAGRTVLVSVNLTGVGGGDDNANYPSISANGQFVAFASAASNLVPGDTNAAADIFVRDLVAGTTTLVSVDPSGAVPLVPMPGAANPIISANGRWVFFESAASNLVAVADGPNSWDVFARNLLAGRTELVSVKLSGTATTEAARSELTSVTPDGRLAAFTSTATNLAAGADTPRGEVYVRNVQAGVTLWASRNVAPYFAGDFRSFNGVLSANGRYAVFKAATPANQPVLVFRHDLETDTTTLLASNSVHTSSPQISDDGRYVAYESGSNVFVWDGQTGLHVLASVSRNGTGPGNGPSGTPALATNGLKVAFLSAASDLGAQGGNGSFQMHVRDLAMATTRLVSGKPDGTPSGANLELIMPALSANGSLAAFDSDAADLGALDTNQAGDVFAQQVGLLDTDGDGMDDDWEMAYFGTLARDGTGDFDSDGARDMDEFLAGTEPISNGSVLRSAARPSVTISWPASPGKNYKVQYRSVPTGMEWMDLPGTVVVNGLTGWQADNEASGQAQRFYRVVVLP